MVLEGIVIDGLRKEAALTRGPVMLAKHREERGRDAHVRSGPAAAQPKAGQG
jgi:hypothetical protein